MKAEYDIDVDIAHDLVRITMSGFFSEREIADFVDARNRAHALLRCGPHEHVTLVDIRHMRIQSQESVVQFQKVLNNPERTSRRLAFVTAQSLARLQVRRAADGREARYFSDPAEAEAWLLGA